MITSDKRPAAIRVVLPFVFRHWLNQPVRAAVVAGGLLGATVADLFLPVFSGHLVDAMTAGASDPASRRAARGAVAAIVPLGLVSMILLGLHWPSLGLVIAVGAMIYVPMIVVFT